MVNSKYKIISKIIAGVLISVLGVEIAFSAALTGMSDTMSSAKVSTASNHSFQFTTPTGIGAGSTTIIAFPSEFEIPTGFTFADVDINVGGPYNASATLAAAPSGATWGVARTSSTTLTITNGSGAVAPASTVYIRLGTNAISQSTGSFQVINATTTGSKSIGIAGNMSDNGTTTVNIINNDTVQISAVVLQALTFSISSNAIAFGNLDSGSAKYASSTNESGDTVDTVAHTLSVSTNATAGYSITVQGQTLTSQQNANDTISAIGAIPATSSAGTEQFGIYATKSGGVNGTITAPYVTASSFGYNGTATTSALFASGSTPTNTETYSLHYLANIAILTEAGTYSANLVYVGTANF
ncbi:hypothetical protein K9M47_00680 [Candidatus Gracilibacteria bacterium]|nr:hypothetical protein [Candidatus Gracilibacteria bacterium]MCF7898355.1 hypothetical protein [Candidatus Paceibacterota bacterium]